MPTVRYAFDLTRPHTHLIQVTMVIPPHDAPFVDLVMPSWIPGAYKIVDHARNVRAFVATGQTAMALAYERLNKQTWRVYTKGATAHISYGMFANKPEIHQSQLDAHHAFLNPGVLALYVDGHKQDWEVELKLDLPETWRVATALEATGPASFKAHDYEELMDCPIEAGHFAMASFELDAVRYDVVYEGATEWDPAEVVPALSRVILAATDFWGRPPLARYVFMYLETQAGYLNGLEHCTSTIITGPVADPAQREGLIAMTAHEFFHLWNVKRLRPVGLGPFDYTREAHTTALWVVEGFTEYYTDRLLLQSGLQSPEHYLNGVTRYIQQLEAMPGRRNMSLEEASWTTWHFGDDRWNGSLNYYVKGYLLGVALDLELRSRTGDQLSLDDVMRAMWDAHGLADVPYRSQDFREMAEKLLGETLSLFWDRYLLGREDFDWNQTLAPAGLRLVERAIQSSFEITPKTHEGGLLLENVLADGAAQKAGLMAGDCLVAIGDRRATLEELSQLHTRYEPGQVVEVHYFRRNRLQFTRVTLAKKSDLAIIARAEATPTEQALGASWLSPSPSFTGKRQAVSHV
jgi:predicted metalloprotease with PDZ domain